MSPDLDANLCEDFPLLCSIRREKTSCSMSNPDKKDLVRILRN